MAPKTTWAFRVQDSEPDVLAIDIYDVVGDDFWFGGVTAKAVREKLVAAQGVRKINVRINSGGGDVFDGFAIYNLLSQHKAKVTVDVDGLAGSIASVIAMAGDKIRMAENAMMMIHNPWTIAMGDGPDMRAAAEMLDKVCAQIATTYAARTTQKVADIMEWMGAETWFTAAEALERGFATEVTPAKQAAAKAFYNLEGCKRAPAELRAAVAEAFDITTRAVRATQPSRPTEAGAKPAKEDDDMDLKQLEAELAKARAELATATQALSERDVAAKAHSDTRAKDDRDLVVRAGFDPEKVTTVGAAIDTLLERTTKAERVAVEAEVDKLVGEKLVPAERDTMVALAQKDRPTFDALVAARLPLNIVGPRLTEDKNATPPAGSEGASAAAADDLSAAAERKARG